MSRLQHIIRIVKEHPKYTLMRGAARFGFVRWVVTSVRHLVQRNQLEDFIEARKLRQQETFFPNIDPATFAEELKTNGIAFGLRLPESLVEEIRKYAEITPCYADREPSKGFTLSQRDLAGQKLGKAPLIAQYFNTAQGCPAVAKLIDDPVLQEIAARYLGSVPTYVGTNLWWTFPVKVTEEEQSKYAHLFHRDVDDFRFFKFFFYLTDVNKNDGAHMCVVASHRNPPQTRPLDRWNIRRYKDSEISGFYPGDNILEISGKAGDGFAEDTLCVHKARTPEKEPRLLLQLQYALFDYGVAHDNCDTMKMKMVA